MSHSARLRRRPRGPPPAPGEAPPREQILADCARSRHSAMKSGQSSSNIGAATTRRTIAVAERTTTENSVPGVRTPAPAVPRRASPRGGDPPSRRRERRFAVDALPRPRLSLRRLRDVSVLSRRSVPGPLSSDRGRSRRRPRAPRVREPVSEIGRGVSANAPSVFDCSSSHRWVASIRPASDLARSSAAAASRSRNSARFMFSSAIHITRRSRPVFPSGRHDVARVPPPPARPRHLLESIPHLVHDGAHVRLHDFAHDPCAAATSRTSASSAGGPRRNRARAIHRATNDAVHALLEATFPSTNRLLARRAESSRACASAAAESGRT